MEKGLERSDLARLVGVTPQLVGQWESGIVKNIRLPNLVRLLDALDLSLRYLVQGADRSSPPIKLLPAPPTPLQTATNVLQQAFGSGLLVLLTVDQIDRHTIESLDHLHAR